jgi:hypothetical protein
MGACQSRNDAEHPSASTPKGTLSFFLHHPTRSPASVTIIPDVDDDGNEKEASASPESNQRIGSMDVLRQCYADSDDYTESGSTQVTAAAAELPESEATPVPKVRVTEEDSVSTIRSSNVHVQRTESNLPKSVEAFPITPNHENETAMKETLPVSSCSESKSIASAAGSLATTASSNNSHSWFRRRSKQPLSDSRSSLALLQIKSHSITEEVDPDAPSDEEDEHVRVRDLEQPGLIAPLQPTAHHALRYTLPPSVDPRTVSHFQRMRKSVAAKNIRRSEKIQDRKKDIQGYKQLWKDFEKIKAATPDSDTSSQTSLPSTGNNLTVRRSQRRRQRSFDLSDSSHWFFDFQSVNFSPRHESPSPLRQFQQSAIMRGSASVGAMPTRRLGDYGPLRHLSSSSPSPVITNMEVSFAASEPDDADDFNNNNNPNNDASTWVSDIADDSQYSVASTRRSHGPDKAAIAHLEERLASLHEKQARQHETDDAGATTIRMETNYLVDMLQAVKMGETAPRTLIQGEHVKRGEHLESLGVAKNLWSGTQDNMHLGDTPVVKNKTALHIVSPDDNDEGAKVPMPGTATYKSYVGPDRIYGTTEQDKSRFLDMTRIFDESAIELLDESTSTVIAASPDPPGEKSYMATGLHSPERRQRQSPGRTRKPTTVVQSVQPLHGSIATMSTEEFLRISKENAIGRSLKQRGIADGLGSSTLSITENANLITPEKTSTSISDESINVEYLESIVKERHLNRLSLAQLRGLESNDDTASTSLLLAERVQAQVTDVLTKYRKTGIDAPGQEP